MIKLTPNWTKDFVCIADRCTDCCCIGWEIDIDAEKLAEYRAVSTEDSDMGRRMKAALTVSEDGSDCFKLTEDERCPFLNNRNLCDLILCYGEDVLCDICTLHPRFRTWYGNILEEGHGLCCEAAAELVMNADVPFELESSEMFGDENEADEQADFLFRARDVIINILQGSGSLSAKLNRMTAYAKVLQDQLDSFTYILPDIPSVDDSSCYSGKVLKDLFMTLDPIDGIWTDRLEQLSENCLEAALDNEKALENIAVYTIFRHFMNALDDGDVFSRAVFAAVTCQAVNGLAVVCGNVKSAVMQWSKETEYSEVNMEKLLTAAWESLI